MARLGFFDVLGARVTPLARSDRWLAFAIVAAFALDGASTLAGLAAGGVEANPLVRSLGPLAYVASCALRATLALLVLRATLRASTSGVAARVALVGLVALKGLAAASNAVFVVTGAPLV